MLTTPYPTTPYQTTDTPYQTIATNYTVQYHRHHITSYHTTVTNHTPPYHCHQPHLTIPLSSTAFYQTIYSDHTFPDHLK